MLRTTLAGLLAHKLRLLLTAVAITLGVGFIAGTFVLTDAMDDGVQRTFARSADRVDVAVLPRDEGGGLPLGLLDRAASAPGVERARGMVRGDAPLVGKDGKVVGDVPTAGLSVPDGPLLRYTVDEGRVPRGPREAVLGSRLSERSGFGTGDTVTVLDPKRTPHTFTVVGLIDVGIDEDAGFRGAVGFDPATALRMTGAKGYTEIDLLGGTTAGVSAAVGGGHQVMTGEELAATMAARAGADTEIIRTGLLIFGLVAMLVSALVIYNTFTILIAQRMREMALLRCVGATRRQVFGGVLVESVVVGLVGSLLGLVAGLALGAGALAGLRVLMESAGGPGVPSGAVGLTVRTVAVALLVGVAVTVLSALLPARAATRVAPVAALRTDLEPGGGRLRLGWARIVLTVLFTALGLGIGGYATLAMEPGQTAMFAVALAGGLVFVALIAVMPALVRPLGGAVGALPGRVAGVPGRLAVENARRAPRRTATTTIALTIGVGLMTLFAVVGAGAKETSARKLQEEFPVDFQIATQFGDDRPVPGALAGALRDRPELGAVAELHEREVPVNGTRSPVTTITRGAVGEIVNPEMASGSVGALRPGTVLVSEHTARTRGIATGDTVRIAGKGTLAVAGVFSGEVPMGGFWVTGADFARMFPGADPKQIFVQAAEGVPADTARIAVEDVARPYSSARVNSAAEIKEEFTAAIDMMLMIFAGLLGLAIVIALFGIANTLTLSVVERTRESALLRALGLTRRQLRRMLSVEALVMAVIGALTGVLLGGAFGWAATRALAESAVFVVPYGQIALFMVLAGAAGMLAAVLPGRRAAQASIVESLSAE